MLANCAVEKYITVRRYKGDKKEAIILMNGDKSSRYGDMRREVGSKNQMYILLIYFCTLYQTLLS